MLGRNRGERTSYLKPVEYLESLPLASRLEVGCFPLHMLYCLLWVLICLMVLGLDPRNYNLKNVFLLIKLICLWCFSIAIKNGVGTDGVYDHGNT